MRCSSAAVFAIAALACLVLCFASDVLAHKSVRHHKPKTEEARWEHHRMNRRLPKAEHFQTDEHLMEKGHQDEYSPLTDQSHKSQHKRWGPQHPDWTKLHNFHYRRPQLYEGEPIDDEIEPEDYHLFGLKHQEYMSD